MQRPEAFVHQSTIHLNIMSEYDSIHMFDINLIIDYFSETKRQGPGSPEMTLKALSFVDNLSPNARIADIGCGTGGQTMVLAQHVEGSITGVDLFPTFIDQFNANAKELNLSHRVQGILGSMDNLQFEPESLDLIWCEGAIYNIGFERGLREWRRFLKTDGYVAVSEATWFTSERPKEIEDFWMDEYPGIDTLGTKVEQMQKAGYVPIAAFLLPNICWTENYYDTQAKAKELFLAKHAGNPSAEGFMANQLYEESLYQKYSKYYGYAFYIGRKI